LVIFAFLLFISSISSFSYSWWSLELASIFILSKWFSCTSFHRNTPSNNMVFLDFIIILGWISSILDMCIRNWYGILLYAYLINTQSLVLDHILTFLGSSIDTFVRHPYPLRYLEEGLLPFHNSYVKFSNFLWGNLLNI
jgi:hypothetical protein